MVGLFARGRIAWWFAIALGVAFVVVGLVTGSPWWAIAGAVAAVFGIVMLVLSYTTKGATD